MKQHKSDLRKWIIPVQMQVAVVLDSLVVEAHHAQHLGRSSLAGMASVAW